MGSIPRRALVLLAAALLCAPTARAQVVLDPPFGDSMVWPRDERVRVRGRAAPGEALTITFGDARASGVAGADGRFAIALPAQSASSEPRTLVVAGKETRTMENVLVGDVWLCSGQSNMEWPLAQSEGAEEALAAAAIDGLRLFRARPPATAAPGDDPARATFAEARWRASDAESAKGFSAVAWHFARRLRAERPDVPVGLLQVAVGGSPAEAWVSRPSLAADPALAPFVDDGPGGPLVSPWIRDARRGALGDRAGRHVFDPSFLFEAGIAPLAPFPIAGVLWYQGESNAHDPATYERLFATLIGDWRGAFGKLSLPFLFVQLAGFGEPSAARWPELREAQRRALALPHTGMATAIDLGDAADIHPRRKREVGERLAALAFGRVEGPTGSGTSSSRWTQDSVSLRRRTWDSLQVRGGGVIRGLEVAGDDLRFVPAEATLDAAGEEIVCRGVPNPRAVRYAWAALPDGNLENEHGHALAPFAERAGAEPIPFLGAPVALFDGTSLAGWRALGDAVWTPENETLLGASGGGAQSFLATERTYGDFRLEVDLRNETPGTNSGIQVRSHENAQGRLFGYQIEIDPTDRAWSGGLYDEARRGWIQDLKENSVGRAAFRRGEWNRYVVECAGPRIRAWVNGVPTADVLDPLDVEGVIGLQVHSGSETRVRFRDLRLFDLGVRRWRPVAGTGRELFSRAGDAALRLRTHAGDAPFSIVTRLARVASDDPRVAPLLAKPGEHVLSVITWGLDLSVHVDGVLAFGTRLTFAPSDGPLSLECSDDDALARLRATVEVLGPAEVR